MEKALPRIPHEVRTPIEQLYITQLTSWPLCRENYSALAEVERRELPLGDFPAALQYNPARRRSTAAKVDPKSVSERPCFLCADNRPEEQIECPVDEDFTILVNPYPIFPLHLTIAANHHRPQSRWPLQMVAFAEKMKGVCAFYNGAKAGASAPDHMHFQAVADCELPIVSLVEKHHTKNDGPIKISTDFGLDLPFAFLSFRIPGGLEGLNLLRLAETVEGYDVKKNAPDADLINVYTWIDADGHLRIVAIPRKAHRPQCYFATDHTHHTISPGAVDMAGLVICPDKHDFDSITAEELRTIYAQTAFTQEEFSRYFNDIF